MFDYLTHGCSFELMQDINDMLSQIVYVDYKKGAVLAVFALFVMSVASSLIMGFSQVVRMVVGAKPIRPLPILTPPEQVDIDESKVAVADIGVVINDTQIKVKGETLTYFILKKSKFEPDTLKKGTKVIVLKRSKTEAYVKAVEETKSKIKL